MKSDLDIVWIRERFAHMGKHSGYDMLCVALEHVLSRSHSVWPEPEPVPTAFESIAIRRLMPRIKVPLFYGERHFVAELRALRRSALTRKLIHVLYGENNLGLTAHPRLRLRNRVVSTLHQPLQWWKEKRQDIPALLGHLDAAIVLSSDERAAFDDHLPGRVHFIPHGVDTDFFVPSGSNRTAGEMSCLFVGQWLRDFPTLERVIQQVSDQAADIRFDLVVPGDRIDRHVHRDAILRVLHGPRVTWHNGVPDAKLLALYQQSHVLVLPLEKATANNAVVEAMACGLPIVSTDLPAVRDYVSERCALLSAASDADEMAENILSLYRDSSLRVKLSTAARAHAQQNLCWTRIASETMSLYERTMA